MKTTNSVCFLLVLAVWPLGMSLRADQAPTISPEEDQTILIDPTGDGSTLDFTASGGQCDPPTSDPDAGGTGNGDCTWVQDGDMYYVWEYTDTEDDPDNGISGDPGSDDDPGSADGDDGDQSTLSIDESQAGSSSITVYAVQNWKASDGSDSSDSSYARAVTRSPGRTVRLNGPHTSDNSDGSNGDQATDSSSSNPVQANIQKPDNLQFISGQPDAAGSRGSYTFEVLDQSFQPIVSNSTIGLDETVTGTLDITDSNGTLISHTATVAPITGNAANGTDANGYIVDTPVGVDPNSILLDQILLLENLTYDNHFDHDYPDVSINPGVPYQPATYPNAHFHGQQEVVQAGNWILQTVTAITVNPRQG